MQSNASFGLFVTASCGMKSDTEPTVDDWKSYTQVFLLCYMLVYRVFFLYILFILLLHITF